MDVGALLRSARERAELSPQGLADLAGTGRSAINAYEAGHKSPTVGTLDRLLAVCGLQVRATLEPLLAHVDERLDKMLASAPDLNPEELEKFAGSLNDEPGAFKPFGAPNRRLGPVTWAVDGASALALHGLAVEGQGLAVVAVLDDGLRSWLSGNLFTARHNISWWDEDPERMRRAVGDLIYGGLGSCAVRLVEALPPVLRLVPDGMSRVLPVVTVAEVERAHPKYAEVLRRWRERDVA
jgi:transcriptional regulator with XRE-family HTH domain